MKKNGIRSHSFWGTFDIAWGLMTNDATETIISADTEKYDFVVNYEVAELHHRLGYLEIIPHNKDYKNGFLKCNGLICDEVIYDFEVVETEDYDKLYKEAKDYKY